MKVPNEYAAIQPNLDSVTAALRNLLLLINTEEESDMRELQRNFWIYIGVTSLMILAAVVSIIRKRGCCCKKSRDVDNEMKTIP